MKKGTFLIVLALGGICFTSLLHTRRADWPISPPSSISSPVLAAQSTTPHQVETLRPVPTHVVSDLGAPEERSDSELGLRRYLQTPQIDSRFQPLKELLGDDLPIPLLVVLVANRVPSKIGPIDSAASQAAMVEIRKDPGASFAALREAMNRMGAAPGWDLERQLIFEIASSIVDLPTQGTSQNRETLEEMKGYLRADSPVGA